MKVSSLIKGSICVLGLVGAGSLFSAPASANQASATGSTVVTRMDGSSVSVSGELTLPSGLYYDTDLTVTPTYDGDIAAGTQNIVDLTITPTAIAEITATSANPVVTAVADAITAAGDTSTQSALIRAAGGSTGFTALD